MNRVIAIEKIIWTKPQSLIGGFRANDNAAIHTDLFILYLLFVVPEEKCYGVTVNPYLM